MMRWSSANCGFACHCQLKIIFMNVFTLFSIQPENIIIWVATQGHVAPCKNQDQCRDCAMKRMMINNHRIRFYYVSLTFIYSLDTL